MHHLDFSDEYGEPDYVAVMDALARGRLANRSATRAEWEEGWPIRRASRRV